jgi:hypothetical protein
MAGPVMRVVGLSAVCAVLAATASSQINAVPVALAGSVVPLLHFFLGSHGDTQYFLSSVLIIQGKPCVVRCKSNYAKRVLFG